jgi:hypothetical protein
MKRMMTRLQGVLPGLLSRKLFHSSSYDNALSYDDLVAMVIKSDDKLRMERSKLRDVELKNVSLQNSFEELKTTHENLKISHETLNISWGTLKEKHEDLKEAHNSLLAQEVKGKISIVLNVIY